jgi:hypothetical protein
LLPCEVEITPPRTVDFVGRGRFNVTVWVVVLEEELVVLLDCPVEPVEEETVAVGFASWAADKGGEAKLALIEPGRIRSSMVGSMVVLYATPVAVSLK